MKLELKSVKIHDDMFEETTCFSATLHADGKRVAHVKNEGRDGCNFYHWESPEIGKKVRQWAETQPRGLRPLARPRTARPGAPGAAAEALPRRRAGSLPGRPAGERRPERRPPVRGAPGVVRRRRSAGGSQNRPSSAGRRSCGP